jgi:transcriptional regulator GlxA family with amidase domain
MGNGSPRLSRDRVQTSVSGDTMGEKLAECADIQAEIDALIKKLVADRHRIIGEIHMLTDARYIQILYLHYVDDKKLEDVAEMMVKTNGEPYSYDHIASLHGMALREFDRIILKSHGNPK